MKEFKYDEEKKCFEAEIVRGTKILIDTEFLQNIYSGNYKSCNWKTDENGYFYVSNKSNSNNRIFLFSTIRKDLVDPEAVKFKNENIHDYRLSNLGLKSETDLPSNFKIIKSFEGYKPSSGPFAGKYLNPYWLVSDTKIQQEDFYVMQCGTKFCYFSKESIDKILLYNDKRPIWKISDEEEVTSSIGNIRFKMHHVVKDFHAHGNSESKTIHINGNKLDNRLVNIKIIKEEKKKLPVNKVELDSEQKLEDKKKSSSTKNLSKIKN